jgi:hypothetical protein
MVLVMGGDDGIFEQGGVREWVCEGRRELMMV